jgi:NTP pyrophosphatase (non-canonical NTP hydrolase)
MILDTKKIQKYMNDFATQRNWSQYKTPKSLCMALAVEVGELMEIFQWIDNVPADEIKDPEILRNAREEMADVLSYLLQLASVLNVDLEKAFWEKTKKNEKKYSVSTRLKNLKKDPLITNSKTMKNGNKYS